MNWLIMVLFNPISWTIALTDGCYPKICLVDIYSRVNYLIINPKPHQKKTKNCKMDSAESTKNHQKSDEKEKSSRTRIKSWETYKILNKIKENIQQKKKIARDVFVSILFSFSVRNRILYYLEYSKMSKIQISILVLPNRVSMHMEIKSPLKVV